MESGLGVWLCRSGLVLLCLATTGKVPGVHGENWDCVGVQDSDGMLESSRCGSTVNGEIGFSGKVWEPLSLLAGTRVNLGEPWKSVPILVSEGMFKYAE